MSRRTLRIGLAVMAVALLASTAAAVGRVPRGHGRRQVPGYYPRTSAPEVRESNRTGVFEVYTGLSAPTGLIDHLGNMNFRNAYRPINFSAGDVYKPSFSLGATVGTMQMGHWYNSIGFQYSHLRVRDTIVSPRSDSAIIFNYTDAPKPNFNQYDVRFNSNWHFYDLQTVGWTPYVGLGVGVGLIRQTLEGYDSHTELNLGLAMNFGAEVKIWQDPNGDNMVTLASANSWEFAGTGYRPKALTLGVGLRIYSHL